MEGTFCGQRASKKFVSAGFFLFLGIGYCSSPDTAFAQQSTTVRSLKFIGNIALSSDELLETMSTKPGSSYVKALVESDKERILNRYRDAGYMNASVDSISTSVQADGEGVDLKIAVREGKPSIVDTLYVEGRKALSEEQIRNVMQTRTGGRFSPQQLERDIEELLQAYDQAGFPFVKIAVGEINVTESGDRILTGIHLKIEEGMEVRIQELRVEGNTRTNDAVIIREARLHAGEKFRNDLAGKIKTRLEHMQLFSSVSTPDLFINDKGEAGLLVRVVEGNQNSFDGIVGYVPSFRTQDAGYFTGLASISLRNLLGTGRRISTRWFREDRSSQEIELHYFEPWVASYPVNAGLGFFQRKQDSAFVRSKYDLTAELMVTEYLSVGGSFSQSTVVPGEGYGRAVVPESRSTSLGISVRYDSRDDAATPTSGIFYETELQSGSKTITPSLLFPESKNTTQRVSFDFLYYISPSFHQVAATELHLRDYSTARIDQGDLYRLGGATTLRGYREGQFLGSRIVWANMEYRFLVAQRSFFYGFLDLGWVVMPENAETGLHASQIQRTGYGVGVRMDSPVGLIGVSVALGEGDTFSSAKLHVRLANEF